MSQRSRPFGDLHKCVDQAQSCSRRKDDGLARRGYGQGPGTARLGWREGATQAVNSLGTGQAWNTKLVCGQLGFMRRGESAGPGHRVRVRARVRVGSG